MTLGAQVAGRLEREIRAMGWPVGRALGSEAELTARFGVGVAVIREASRILAARGIARSRRGPGGGLFVIAPDRQMVTDVARLYLERTGVDPRELFDAWCAMEQVALANLAATLDADGASRLRGMLGKSVGRSGMSLDLVGIHIEIARLAGNAVLELGIRTVAELALAPGGTSILSRLDLGGWHRMHADLVESVVAGDADTAQLLLGVMIEGLKRAAGARSARPA